MFKELNIGPCFVQGGISSGLEPSTLTDDYDSTYNQWLAVQTVDADVDDVIIKCVQVIMGPLMIGIGVANAVD